MGSSGPAGRCSTRTPGSISTTGGSSGEVARVYRSDSMPALASSPARARTVTFMPPESPTPGGASGGGGAERTPTGRVGRSNTSPRAPHGRRRPATVTRSTRGCLPAGAHMLPAFAGYLSPTLAAASFTALVSAAAALRALVPAAFTDDRVVRVLRRTRVLAALVRETAPRVASVAWRGG